MNSTCQTIHVVYRCLPVSSCMYKLVSLAMALQQLWTHSSKSLIKIVNDASTLPCCTPLSTAAFADQSFPRLTPWLLCDKKVSVRLYTFLMVPYEQVYVLISDGKRLFCRVTVTLTCWQQLCQSLASVAWPMNLLLKRTMILRDCQTRYLQFEMKIKQSHRH